MNKKIIGLITSSIIFLPGLAFADNTKIYENEEVVNKKTTVRELVEKYHQQKANKDIEINPYYDPDMAGSSVSDFEDISNYSVTTATGTNLLDEKRRQILIQKEEEEEIINNEPTIIKD